MMIGLGALSLAPSGRVLSVDALRESVRVSGPTSWFTRTSPFARWPLLLISWFFAFMLFVGRDEQADRQWLSVGLRRHTGLLPDKRRNAKSHPVSPMAFRISRTYERGLMDRPSFRLTFGLALVVRKLGWIYVCVGFSFHVGASFDARTFLRVHGVLLGVRALVGTDHVRSDAARRRRRPAQLGRIFMSERDRISLDSPRVNAWLVYDGECPFCCAYASYLRVRESVGVLHLIDARDGGSIIIEEIQSTGLI